MVSVIIQAPTFFTMLAYKQNTIHHENIIKVRWRVHAGSLGSSDLPK